MDQEQLRAAFYTEEEAAQQIENGRYAMDVLIQDLQLADLVVIGVEDDELLRRHVVGRRPEAAPAPWR